LTCVGIEGVYSYVSSPFENKLSDKVIKSALIGLENVKKYSFLNRGNDERQYCSPGIDLPLCSFSKELPGKFEGYHTNADNFDLVTEKGLQESLEVLKDIIDAFESILYPELVMPCEPALGKRGLYPEISQKSNWEETFKIRANVIAYSNGKNNIFDIANITSTKLNKVTKEVNLLNKNGILK